MLLTFDLHLDLESYCSILHDPTPACVRKREPSRSKCCDDEYISLIQRVLRNAWRAKFDGSAQVYAAVEPSLISVVKAASRTSTTEGIYVLLLLFFDTQ